MLDLGRSRWLRSLRGWLLAVAAVAALAWYLYNEPRLRQSLVQTAAVIEREWTALPEVRCTVPASLGLSEGTLFSAYFADGTEEVIGEVGRIERLEGRRGYQLHIRLLPEADQHLSQHSRVELVYPPRSDLEAAWLVFDEPFQRTLVARLKTKAGDLFEKNIQPRAYALMEGAFAKIRPTDANIESFIAEDLYPKLEEQFSDDFELMKKKLLEDLESGLSAWDKAGLGWDLLFGDAAQVEGVLGPLAKDSLTAFWEENRASLLAQLYELWPHYQQRSLTYFEDVVVPILFDAVLVPLFEENKKLLLDRSLEELKWAYAETILAPDDSFDRLFIYVARHLVLRRRESKLFVRPVAGPELAPDAELPLRVYFRPGSPPYSIEPAIEREDVR